MSKNYTIEISDDNPFIDFDEKDLKLVPSFDSISEFRPSVDKIEFSIYNEQEVLEYINYNYTNYSITSGFNSNTGVASELNINPGEDLIEEGFEQGTYKVTYNFFREKVSTSKDNPLFIQEISSDRTELRLASNTLSNQEIETSTNSFITELNGSPFFEDFYLNFGNNVLSIATNIALDDSDDDQFTIIVKLYEPLPPQLSTKDTLWIVLQTAEVISFNVEFSPKVIPSTPPIFIKGPNLDLKIKDELNNSSIYQNLNNLTSTILTSSKDELKSVLNKKGVNIDVNYEDFNDFIYFSSAGTRLKNFYYKVTEITEYQEEIDTIKADITGSTSGSLAVSSSLGILEQNISSIIENFDDYDKFLYYTSGSDYTWPKTTTVAPYTLALTGSSLFTDWYGQEVNERQNAEGILGSASLYDESNVDRLVNTLPSFIKDDPINQPAFLFIDMLGQHFDVFWTYTKAIGDRYNADNRLSKGISKDLVADAIRSMGVNLYQNNFSTNDLYSAFIGINASGSLLPPTGSEIIENYITASSDITKLDDVNKETYKRIFHNLPFLLKTKGTVTGLRALINTYGIPDTILRISEFGGKDIDNSNDWDYYQNKFNYALYNSGGNYNNANVNVPFGFINPDWNSFSDIPETLFFRFKPSNILPTEDEYSCLATTAEYFITLEYTGSGYSSSSLYSGSIPSSSNAYATLTYWSGSISKTPLLSASAPFYDGNWWGVQISREGIASDAQNTLRVANSIYDGNDGFKVGYTASHEITQDNKAWTRPGTNLYFPLVNSSPPVLDSNTYYGFTGSYQEIRLYNTSSISEATFHDYVMNPYSIEGTNYSSSADNLIFRAALGSDLDISPIGSSSLQNKQLESFKSIHPKVTGSNATSSFTSDSSLYYLNNVDGKLSFTPQTEFIYYDQPAVGIKNRVSEKIRAVDNVIPSGDTLTPYRTIQQRYPQSESYTRDVNHVEVAFSPQNEINDDINSSFGYFNIGEYIGDPRQISESVTSYQDLDKLRDTYFEKYYKSYDWRDYIRLIKYFDNSLFKMIKDFVPAKSSVTTGVVIKQHLLERNKQRPPVVSYTRPEYSGSINSGSIIGTATGGAGGVFNYANVSGSAITASVSPQLTQSWTYGVSGKSGTFILTQSSQDEFYNGELSGSDVTATDGEMLPFNNFNNTNLPENRYKIKVFRGDGSDNRGQTINRVITAADNNPSNSGNWSKLPGVLRTFVKDVGNKGGLSNKNGQLIVNPQGLSTSFNDTLGFDKQRYAYFAEHSGSQRIGSILSKNQIYFVKNDTPIENIDTFIVDPSAIQPGVTSNGNANGVPQFSFWSKFKGQVFVRVVSVDNPSKDVIFTFASNSFADFNALGTGSEDSSRLYGKDYIVFHSGSILQGTELPGQGENINIYVDEESVPSQNGGILIRDFVDNTYTTPQGELYLFYDTGSDLI